MTSGLLEIVSEHHFVVVSQNFHFVLEASSLKPYLLTEGTWSVKPLYLSSLVCPMGPTGGTRLTSPFAKSGSDTRLVLSSFVNALYCKRGHAIVFDVAPTVITQNTDLLCFDLETFRGGAIAPDPVTVGEEFVLALALIQLR